MYRKSNIVKAGLLALLVSNIAAAADSNVVTKSYNKHMKHQSKPIKHSKFTAFTKDMKLELALGMNVFNGSFQLKGGDGYKVKQRNNPTLRISGMKKVKDRYEAGVSLISQPFAKAKTHYLPTGGATTIFVKDRYSSLAVLATGRYLAKTYKKFTPYCTASVGLSLNSFKEIHDEASISTTYKRKIHLQPAFGVGLGVKYDFNHAKKLFLEYQFLSSGKLKSSGSIRTTGIGSADSSGRVSHKLKQNLLMAGMVIDM